MPVTKTQILNMLLNLKNTTPKGSRKYYTIGAMRILVTKDIITADDVMLEFPELA